MHCGLSIFVSTFLLLVSVLSFFVVVPICRLNKFLKVWVLSFLFGSGKPSLHIGGARSYSCRFLARLAPNWVISESHTP
jgi:hypothetical protein